MTKIVHLVNSLARDGTGRLVMALCKVLDKKDYNISVVSLTQKIDLANSSEWPKHVNVYSFNYSYDSDYSLRRYLTLYFFKRITKKKSKKIRECISVLAPDILHCHLQPRELLIASQIPSNLLFTDHLVRVKNGQYSWLNTWLLAWIYRRILEPFNVVGVARGVMACHLRYQLVNNERIHALIENAIDAQNFVPLDTKPVQPLQIIYIARFEKRKDHETLLRAWSRIQCASQAKLLLIGEGELEENLRMLVNRLVPRHKIEFVGPIDNVLPFLQNAHIAVFPSLHEGLSVALLEKMSCGLPVIASDIKEFRELLTDRVNCLFFKAGDESDLSAKINLLIKDEALRESLGSAARKFVLENYDLKRLKENYEKVYQRVLGSE
jgi:glycosyltransferase involved in cell wall biosynthesis